MRTFCGEAYVGSDCRCLQALEQVPFAPHAQIGNLRHNLEYG